MSVLVEQLKKEFSVTVLRETERLAEQQSITNMIIFYNIIRNASNSLAQLLHQMQNKIEAAGGTSLFQVLASL